MGDELESTAEKASILMEGEKRLGGYRILREVGRGGMGAVFEAFQESLGRRVALKVLPGTFALDPRRLERFRREARATARIHHPSIAPVYEVGEADGNHFYSMEFIEGPSLETVIAGLREEAANRRDPKGSSASDPAYLSSTVERMAALAEGLAEAHCLGLVHRDVKPSNVLVERTGRWVLVDFGLVQDEEAQTITRSGEMVGTLACMSPEQISRQEVDARSDVFSLGVVLYEVLTLQRPFRGESDREVQNAILFDEPVPPRKLNPRMNRDLETILLTALSKRPERRYPSAAELAADLRRLLRMEPIKARPRSALTRLWGRARKHRGKMAAAGVVALLLASSLLAWRLWPEKRIVLTGQNRLTSDAGLTCEPALSANGLIAYASDRGGEDNLDIWVQPFDGGEPRRLTADPADDREPAFSPDGKSIAFRSERDGGGIYVVPAEGGDARLLARFGNRPRYSPDGGWIAYWTGSRLTGRPDIGGELYIIRPQGGEPRHLRCHLSAARYPVWAPGGAHLLFLGLGTPTPDSPREEARWDWWVLPVDGGKAESTGAADALPMRRIGPIPWSWDVKSHRVFFAAASESGQSLSWVAISPRTFKVLDPPEILSQGTAREGDPWLGERGKLAFTSFISNVDLWSLPLDANAGTTTGAIERLMESPVEEILPSVTPDGTKVLYRSPRKGQANIWLFDVKTKKEMQITSSRDGADLPAISSDGSRIAYDCGDGGDSLCIKVLSEMEPRTLARGLGVAWDWSRDGREILSSEHGKPVIVALDVTSGESATILRHRERFLFQSHFDPSARWIAFNGVVEAPVSNSKIFVAPYRGRVLVDPVEWIEVTDGRGWDDKPRWSPDGNLLYFLSQRDGFLCIWMQRLDPSSRRPQGEAEAVHHFHSARRSPMNVNLGHLEMSVARDRIVINLGELTGNIWLVDLEERY